MQDGIVGVIGKEIEENMDTNQITDRGDDKICKTKTGKVKRAKKEEKVGKVRRGKKEKPKEKEKENERNAGDAVIKAI